MKFLGALVLALTLASGCVKQSRFDALQAQLADSQKQLADTKTQLADSQIQLADTKTQLANAQKQLESAQQKLISAQQELTFTNMEFDMTLGLSHLKRPLPVAWMYNKAPSGSGYVLSFGALWGHVIPVKVMITSQRTGRTISFSKVLSSSSRLEFGNDPNQPIEDGDKIELASPDFQTLATWYHAPPPHN